MKLTIKTKKENGLKEEDRDIQSSYHPVNQTESEGLREWGKARDEAHGALVKIR